MANKRKARRGKFKNPVFDRMSEYIPVLTGNSINGGIWRQATGIPRVREQKDEAENRLTLGRNWATGTTAYYSEPYFKRCEDETHGRPRRDGTYRTGGPFRLRGVKTKFTPTATVSFNPEATSLFGYSYVGQFIPHVGGIGNNPPYGEGFVNYILPELDQIYTEAPAKGWRKYRPGNQDANLGQFLGELNRIPTIPLQLKNLKNVGLRNYKNSIRLKQIGDDYLNAVFGWIPFVKDLQEMYKLYHDLGKALDQLRRDNGKPIHRKGWIEKGSPEVTVTESTGTSPAMYPDIHSFFTSPPYKRTKTVWNEERSWFSGTFQYWIPNIDSPRWPAEAERALFGANLTPSLAWELMPWSWLIDWFTNVGDVISNMSANAVDNLVAHYAYVMVERRRRTYYDHTCGFLLEGSSVPTPLSGRFEVEWFYKTRRAASPYGFDVTPGMLSARQVAILGALGLSRYF